MKMTTSVVLALETLAIVALSGFYVMERRGHLATPAPPTARVNGTTTNAGGPSPDNTPPGPFAPRTIGSTERFTSMLPIDLENPARVPPAGQQFDACGPDKTGVVKCVKDVILLDVRCGIRNPGECEAHVALSRDVELDFEAIVAGGQRAHMFVPRNV